LNKNKKYKATASVLGDCCVINVQSYSVLQHFFRSVTELIFYSNKNISRFLFQLLCFVLLIILPELSKGDDTGWLSPSTNPYSINVTNPTRVYSSDNSRSRFDSTNDIADFGGFNIVIPVGSIIEGIEIRIEGRNTDDRQLEAVSLSWNGGNNYSTSTALITFTSTEAYNSISSSLWGRTWQVSELSNSNFLVRLDASFASGDLLIDHLQVKIFYTRPPTITSFTPNNACSGSGTSVVITGTNFTGASAVRFNGVSATSYTVNSATQITATLPVGATTSAISVTTAGGTATSSSAFTVNIVPPAPVVGTITQPTCTLATGSVILNGLPSSGTWTLTRNDGVTTTGTGSSTTLSNLPAGTYTYTVTGENASTTCPGSGTGLLGEYFNNVPTSTSVVPVISGTPALIRTDQTIDFNWANGGPGNPLGNDYFAVRWSGMVQPCYSETYTFTTQSDDGIRLSVNGNQIINNWTDHANASNSGTISLVAGQKYDIVLEYYERAGQAVAQLYWSSVSQPNQIIPKTQLYSVATGCTSVSSASVTINPQPTASTAPTSITGTTTICSGTPVTLTVSGGSLGTGASWNWYSGSCGGTFVGTGNSIIVNPSTTTTYFVRAEGTCNTTTCASGTITVNPAPTLTSISASPTSACAGSDVTITVNGLISGLNTISYDYTIDGSTTSSSVNLTPSGGVASTSLNNLPAGNYQVKINSITVNGCTTNFSTNNTANWTINPEATPTFTQLGPYCAGNTPDALPGTSNNGITGTWNPSTINTATSGTIIYTFTPTAGQCATTAAMSVTVNSLPAVFNVTGGGTYCGSALAIGLSDSETGINYQLFRDGSTLVSTVAGTGPPISFVPQSDIGTYTVVANNSVTGCAINMSGSAIISADSEAPVARCKTNVSVNINASGQAVITPAMVDNGSTDNCGIMSMIVSPETLSCAGSGSTATTYSKDIVSSDGYTVHISVTDMWVEPSTNNCAVGGYNYTIGYNYSISFSGSGIPSALDNFDILIGCDHTMYGELPETQGTGTNFTNSQYRSNSDCATVTPDDIHCSVVNVRIQGPGISYQTVTLDPISGSGSNTVTLTVTDAAGNSNSCTTNVTLIDAVSPAITCPANVAVSADANSCSATGVSLETAATDDNCGVASIINNAPASFPVGNTTVTWTVTDNAGNTNTCAQTVTVDPNPVDIEVVDLGNSCQSGETGSQTSVAWTVNKLSGVGSWTYYYEIKNGSTVVANATRTVTGSADSVNFTVNNITNTNLNYTITISGVSDDCGTTETNTANNSDTVTLFGVPDTGDIHTN
jgi:hypothetical protein